MIAIRGKNIKWKHFRLPFPTQEFEGKVSGSGMECLRVSVQSRFVTPLHSALELFGMEKERSKIINFIVSFSNNTNYLMIR